MKLKKLVALGLSTGLAVSSLAACGQKSEPAATKGESVSTEAAKAETSGKEEAKAEARLKKKVKERIRKDHEEFEKEAEEN